FRNLNEQTRIVNAFLVVVTSFHILEGSFMLCTGHQLRAARSLIGWEQTDVASASGLSVNTIRTMEASGAAAIAGRAANVQKIQKALEEGGIEFLNHGSPGVRLRPKP